MINISPEQITLITIPLDRIVSRLPVRRLSPSGVARIQKSIQRSGFLDTFPLLVEPLGAGEYKLIDGNHRYEAARACGIIDVPCVVKTDLTEQDCYRLALQSNSAAESMVPSTLVTYAEFVWARSKNGDTLPQIATMLDWHPSKVKNYSALSAICEDAWKIVVTTFEEACDFVSDDDVTARVTTVTFTEGLLRSILDITPGQQLELVQALAHPDKNQRITKNKFTELAKAYRARNEMYEFAFQHMGDLGKEYTAKLHEEIYSGAYDAEWIKSKEEKSKTPDQHPKLDKLVQSLHDEWEQKNSIHLVCGNFYEEVKKIGSGSIDLILTDPPYNIANAREFALEGRSNISQDFGEWDKYAESEFVDSICTWATEWARILRDQGSGYVFTSDRYISVLIKALELAGLTFKTTITWHKTNPSPQFEKTIYRSTVEYVLFFTKDKSKYTFNWQGDGKEMHNFIETANCGGNERLTDAKKETLHPTQKPEQVLRHLMEVSSNRGDLIFDGFMGVGSTGAVAKKLGRKFTGIEQEKKYFDAAVRRLAE